MNIVPRSEFQLRSKVIYRMLFVEGSGIALLLGGVCRL